MDMVQRVFLVRISRIWTEHGPEKLQIQTLFQQLVTLCKNCLDTNVKSSCFIQHCNTSENMKFSFKDFLCKCQQTIFTKKTISEKFIFCALYLLKSLFREVLKNNQFRNAIQTFAWRPTFVELAILETVTEGVL